MAQRTCEMRFLFAGNGLHTLEKGSRRTGIAAHTVAERFLWTGNVRRTVAEAFLFTGIALHRLEMALPQTGISVAKRPDESLRGDRAVRCLSVT